LSYTRIAVLDQGVVVEYDSPLALFAQPDGIFRSMCDRSAITQDEVQAAADLRDSQM
jgi:ABC-type multidrug transport system fused ATPase/permease subunit